MPLTRDQILAEIVRLGRAYHLESKELTAKGEHTSAGIALDSAIALLKLELWILDTEANNEPELKV